MTIGLHNKHYYAQIKLTLREVRARARFGSFFLLARLRQGVKAFPQLQQLPQACRRGAESFPRVFDLLNRHAQLIAEVPVHA